MDRSDMAHDDLAIDSDGAVHLDPLPSRSFSAMADLDLVAWAQRDDAAFAELFSRHANNVRRRALQRTGSPEIAELIVASTATRARRTINASSASSDVRRWILDATENECIGWFERGRPRDVAGAPIRMATPDVATARSTPPSRIRSAVGRAGARALAGVRAAARPDRLI